MRTTTKILIAAIAVIIALAVLWLAPAVTQAQTEGEGTIPRLEKLVEDLLERVDRLESIWEGPGPALDNTNDAHCIIAFSGQMGGRPFLQNETKLRYLAQYGELPTAFVLITVKIDRETGETLLVYATQTSGRWTVEHWNGCSFEGSDDWQEAAG
ncbi:MAG: hypothetical protein OXJ55_08755 [Caldilineaceae bacterium]|nr:hypothetical protein [Caldilineaceae bacterium]MDE0461684.1 hypothetical protein [Caldilineaceae bacterium]MDE0462994.1 hypothetical protein [Caldilineaceae bacterium]